MNLHALLAQRAASGKPVRVGLIGAGKFGSMVLAQAQRIEGMHVVGVADLNVGRARASLARVGWPEERYGRPRSRTPSRPARPACWMTQTRWRPSRASSASFEATGHPIAGVRHALPPSTPASMW